MSPQPAPTGPFDAIEIGTTAICTAYSTKVIQKTGARWAPVLELEWYMTSCGGVHFSEDFLR